MAFDKSTPAGSTKVSLGDNAIRDNNDALEDALGGTVGDGADLAGAGTPRPGEHRFVTGGDQSGRHTFKHGTSTEQAALSTSSEDDGWVIMRTDIRSGKRVWMVYDGSAWDTVDVGVTDIPRVDENSVYTAVQEFVWESVSPSGGTLTLDCETDHAKYATVPASSVMTIANLSNKPAAGNGCTIYLKLTNAGTGSSLSWGSEYRTANGVTPSFDTGSGAINIYALTVLDDGNVWISSAPDLGTF